MIQITRNDVMTLANLQEAMNLIQPCPLKEYMIERGCDPADGWILILPVKEAEKMGPYKPSYVLVSKVIEQPFVTKVDKLNLPGELKCHD